MSVHPQWSLAALLCVSLAMHVLGQDRLVIEAKRAGSAQVQIGWTNASDVVLEEADELSPAASWRLVEAGPVATGPTATLTLPAQAAARFYRLHRKPGALLTRIAETSPAAGETGVAPTRETILRFNRPLAPTASITTNELSATAAGRPLLARTEVAGDRRQATLFFLENLPGSARVRVSFSGDHVLDANGRAVDADQDGQPGGSVEFVFDTGSLDPAPATAVIGRVFASELVPGADTGTNAVNRPLAGVTITVDGREETMRTTTDAMGNFKLEACPSGRFFVHVDGRTAAGSAWPSGAYYPYVGKAWETVAGVATNLAGGGGVIYLPLVAAGTLQPTSLTRETTITFPPAVLSSNPALAGVSITVPPNSLFANDGTRGGRLGLAPVPPDRLPEPLPPGLHFPLVITVQSDGPSNFDQPVPVRFPNLPDPVGGLVLAPGASSALWAFNHDTGRWEIQGPMTVSADGRYVECDPGVGIRQPGWVGIQPGTPTPYPDPKPRKPDPCDQPTSNVVENVVDLGAALAKCVAEFSGAANALKAALDIAIQLRDLADDVQSLLAQAEKGNSVGATAKAFKSIAGAKAIAVAAFEAFKSQSPLGRLEKGVNCADTILNSLENICDRSVSMTGPCGTFVVRTACVGVSAAKSAIPGAKLLLNEANGAVKNFALELSCALVDQIGSQLELASRSLQVVQGRKGPRLAGPDDPVPSEILQQMRELHTVEQSLVAQWRPVADVAAAAGGWVEAFGGIVESTTDVYQEFMQTPGAAPYRLEMPLGVLRGTTRNDGGLDVILPPEATVTLTILDLVRGRIGQATFTTARAGQASPVPLLRFAPPADFTDTDGEGLIDTFEAVLGTASDAADTDGDGVSDFAEVRSGQNPLDGLVAATGVIAASDTPGKPADIAAFNDLVAVADGASGLALFNVFGGLTPTLIAQIKTPVAAVAVDCDRQFGAVALGQGGLGIVDLSEPLSEGLSRVVPLGGPVGEVAVSAGLGFAAVGREVVSVDLATGVVLDRLDYTGRPGETVHDLVVAGDHLYVLIVSPGVNGSHTISKVAIGPILTSPVAALTVPGTEHPTFGRMHVYADGQFVYVGAADYSARLQIPGAGILRDNGTSLEWVGRPSGISAFDLAPNGSGRLLFTGADPALLSNRRVGLLDISDPALTDRFVTSWDTPGTAVALVIYNGLAYTADDQAGVQVVNFLPFDSRGTPPTVVLRTSASNLEVEAGQRLRLTADATDDVQVRNVEFYVDDVRVATDGNHPFEHAFLVPAPTPGMRSIRIQARAFDTGGNAAWSEPLVVALLPPATATQGKLRLRPAENANVSNLRSVAVILDAPADADTLPADAIELTGAGADLKLGTADDRVFTNDTERYAEFARTMVSELPDELPQGLVRVSFRGVKDQTGRPFPDVTWQFRVVTGTRPSVAGVLPLPNSRGIFADQLRITFSEPMDPNTIIPGAFTLTAAGLDGVLDTADDAPINGGTLTQNPGSKTVIWELASPLTLGRYRARVAASVTDLSGTPLSNPYSWTFSVEDLAPPEVVMISPADGAELTAGPSSIEAFFSEPLAAETISAASVQVTSAGPDTRLGTPDDVLLGPVIEYHTELRRLRLGFPGPLPPGRYGLTSVLPITDLSGNPLRPLRAGFLVLQPAQVVGRVLLPDLAPADAAEIRIAGQSVSFLTGPDGRFVASGLFFQPDLPVTVFARKEALGKELHTIRNLAIPASGIVDAGDLVLREICDPVFSSAGFPTQDLGGEVNAFTIGDLGNGPELFAGTGSFYGRKRAGVFRWIGTRWEQLGTDFTYADGRVAHIRTLAVFDAGSGPGLYAGGDFNQSGGTITIALARWTGTAWEGVDQGLPPLGTGFRRTVWTLHPYEDGGVRRLLAGGQFTLAAGRPPASVIQWDGAVWTPLGDGLIQQPFGLNEVRAFAVFDDGTGPALYAGGRIPKVNDHAAQHLARYRNGVWEGAGTGVTSSGVVDTSYITALRAFDDGAGPALFVGGSFASAGGLEIPSVARWNGSAWSALTPGLVSTRVNTGVNHLSDMEHGGRRVLVLGGTFDRIGDQAAFLGAIGVAVWDGSELRPLRAADRDAGVRGSVNATAWFPDGPGAGLYVGGSFTEIWHDRKLSPMAYAARWNLDQWEPASMSPDRQINDLAWHDDGQGATLYGVGDFEFGGSRRLNGIFKRNGLDLMPLGEGLRRADGSAGQAHLARSVTVAGRRLLFVAGSFERAGPENATNIACWDGAKWISPGGGVASGGGIFAVAEVPDGGGGSLIVGGQFSRIGGVAALSLARWDGTQWSAVGSGVGGSVRALALYHDGTAPALYVAGQFSVAAKNNQLIRNLARWDGQHWQAVGDASYEALPGDVRSMVVHDDGSGEALYVAGSFPKAAGGEDLNSVARWDGVRWTQLTTTLGAFRFGQADFLTVFPDLTGPVVLARVSLLEPFPSGFKQGIAVWDGVAWVVHEVPEPRVGLFSLTAGEEPSGPVVVLGGRFFDAVTPNLTRWSRVSPPCP